MKYEVKKYTEQELLSVIERACKVSPEKVRKGNLFKHLAHRLFADQHTATLSGVPSLHVQTIVVEWEYICNTYRKDYHIYYESGYRNYNKFVSRVHLFHTQFSQISFDNAIIKGNDTAAIRKKIWDGYLGYIVLKPIPNAFIGASCIQDPFLKKTSYQHTSISVVEKLHLFGKELEVKGLSFQARDVAISVCATSALWMAFHKTKEIFNTPHPSAAEIRQLIGPNPDGTRVFPAATSGISIRQIANAIEGVGLVSEIRMKPPDMNARQGDLYNSAFFDRSAKRIIYAYASHLHLPILIGYTDNIDRNTLASEDFNVADHHLVTLAGFQQDSPSSFLKLSKAFDKDYLAFGDEMRCLFVHNDTAGPYIPILFQEDKEHVTVSLPKGDKLVDIVTLIVPVLPAIRVNFEDVSQVVREINIFAKKAIRKIYQNSETKNKIVWEVYVDRMTHYKERIRKEKHNSELKRRILYTSYPEYIWIARIYQVGARNSATLLCDIIFDATDSPASFCCFQVNYYDDVFKTAFWGELTYFFEEFIPYFKSLSETAKSEMYATSLKSFLTTTHYQFLLQEVGSYGMPADAKQFNDTASVSPKKKKLPAIDNALTKQIEKLRSAQKPTSNTQEKIDAVRNALDMLNKKVSRPDLKIYIQNLYEKLAEAQQLAQLSDPQKVQEGVQVLNYIEEKTNEMKMEIVNRSLNAIKGNMPKLEKTRKDVKRLRKRLHDREKELSILYEKENILREAIIIEADVLMKFKYQHQLRQTEEEIKTVKEEIQYLQNKLKK